MCKEIITIPSKKSGIKMAVYIMHLLKRIQKGPEMGISIKLQEEDIKSRHSWGLSPYSGDRWGRSWHQGDVEASGLQQSLQSAGYSVAVGMNFKTQCEAIWAYSIIFSLNFKATKTTKKREIVNGLTWYVTSISWVWTCP